MLNKNFKAWLHQSKKSDLLQKLTKSLDDLYASKEVRINTNAEDLNNHLFNFFNHETSSFKNLIYFRLYDLGTSLIPLIEKKNYTTSVIICRSIFETILIFMFRMLRINDRIDRNDWKSLYIEILNFRFEPSWKDNDDINWEKVFPHLKKFHINDAIRSFSKVLEPKKSEVVEKILFDDYANMSNISHPNQANQNLYINRTDKINLDTKEKKTLRDNFSVNHADKTVFPIFVKQIEMFLIFDKNVYWVMEEFKEKLENNREKLFYYQKNKFKDDLISIQPALGERMNEIKGKDLSSEEIVEDLVKNSYKK